MAEDEYQRWEKQSVFKLPPHVTSLNDNAFKPKVVSFGPYHYNEQHLKPMEAHKDRSLNRFLKILNKTLDQYLESFMEMNQQLMDYYEQLNDKWRNGNSFLELMVRDGCFMIDILHSAAGYGSEYSANDPVFGRSAQSNVMYQNIKRDMLLIENQLPLLVLEKLLADSKVVLVKLLEENPNARMKVEAGNLEKEELMQIIHSEIHERILKFFECYERLIPSSNSLCLHALDVFRENAIQRSIERGVTIGVSPTPDFPSATVLRHTGVKFERNDTSCLMAITFNNGVLILPHLFINKDTEPTFLNLMAFERFQTGKGQEVSAYVDFMGSLVRSAKDVSLLRSKKIITSGESNEAIARSNEAIARLFSELAKNQIVDPDDSLDEVRQRLNNHYRRNFLWGRFHEKLAEWKSNFLETYCKNPWTVIGLVAGIILLALTITQTFYTVLPFYRKEHSSPPPPPPSPSHRRRLLSN